jgi:hypothetical protein
MSKSAFGGRQTTMGKEGDFRGLVRANAHVTIHDINDPMKNFMEVLYNPPELEISGDVDIGELKPIGWSGSVLMFGGTSSPTFPMELYLSQFGFMIFRYGNVLKDKMTARWAAEWLTSFAFPTAKGHSSAILIIDWPNTLRCQAVIKHWKIRYTRWDADMQPREATVHLDLIERRVQFKTQYAHEVMGMRGGNWDPPHANPLMSDSRFPEDRGVVDAMVPGTTLRFGR